MLCGAARHAQGATTLYFCQRFTLKKLDHAMLTPALFC